MNKHVRCGVAGIVLGVLLVEIAPAATLTIVLENGDDIAAVGVFRRWDADGNPRKSVDPKAKIDAPQVDANAARRGDGSWMFENLEPGKYDLVLMGKDRVRIEGWEYAPVLEFDPFIAPTATAGKKVRDIVYADVKNSRHYENKVVPLAAGGDGRVVRVLVMLLRDLPTSYTKGAGTLRFEIWQYTENYGAWVKERRTRVMHRLLAPVAELRRWTWVWEPALGAVEVKDEPVIVRYRVPKSDELKKLPGLQPY